MTNAFMRRHKALFSQLLNLVKPEVLQSTFALQSAFVC